MRYNTVELKIFVSSCENVVCKWKLLQTRKLCGAFNKLTPVITLQETTWATHTLTQFMVNLEDNLWILIVHTTTTIGFSVYSRSGHDENLFGRGYDPMLGTPTLNKWKNH